VAICFTDPDRDTGMHAVILIDISQHIIFEVLSFALSKDMIGAQNLTSGQV